MNGNRRRNAAKLYLEDIVQLVESPKSTGIVVRCWHDAEEIHALPEDIAADPMMRPLDQGEVGVSFFPRGLREILPEAKLDLVDRMYQPGDLLKKSVDDVRAGIVTSLEIKGRLVHAISNEEVPGLKSSWEVDYVAEVEMGDFVVYDDWVGQVVEMFDESLIEVGGSSGALVRLPELSAHLAVGQKGSHILPYPMSSVHGLFNFLLGSPRPSQQDTVLEVRRTVLAIAWLAINQSLDGGEAASRQRPPRFWHGPNLSKLTVVRRRAQQCMRVGDRVTLKDSISTPMTVHGKEGEPPLGIYRVRTLVVSETHTMVNVLWQDGTRECLDARNTVPYLNPDEYDCWPGDHVLWKNEGQKRAAVVQGVNAADRTAYVRFLDSGKTELVSVLELDPHGTSDGQTLSPHEGLGIHRGEFVFIHGPTSTNGSAIPMVPKLGEIEPWVREAPMVNRSGHPSGWRKEVIDIGNKIAQNRGRDESLEEGLIRRPRRDDPSLNWFGEVTDLRLDGNVEVVLPNSSVVVLPLNRLTRLYDGMEQLEDMADDGDEEDEEEDSDYGGAVEYWDADGRWVQGNVDGDADGWSTDDDAMDVDMPARWISTSPPTHPQQLDPTSDRVPEMNIADSIETSTSSEPSSSNSPSAVHSSPDTSTEVDMDSDDAKQSHWKRFTILPSAPIDHAFYASAPAQPSRSFLGRLAKEYRALESSLPESILVRAYEDRTDLLRSLIIGPENTPYEDAPFVIDWQLDSNFPQSPPIAHFLSWTNGNGRVNPNLYEEGKVCLSILGTWAGDKNETWSAARSSLLQALVSIQGLVLVKEPWFCEPAFEKLRGTEDGIVNSRLYSEKAYVLSRGFVRRALELPPGSLASELQWLYYDRGKLTKVLRDSRALIQKSKASAEPSTTDSDLAVPRLTGGGIITLERTLAKLQGLLSSPVLSPSSPSSSS